MSTINELKAKNKARVKATYFGIVRDASDKRKDFEGVLNVRSKDYFIAKDGEPLSRAMYGDFKGVQVDSNGWTRFFNEEKTQGIKYEFTN